MMAGEKSNENGKPLFLVSPGPGGDFRRIQEAIEAAPSQGARIRIAAGVYREKLFASRPGIELEGEGRDSTRLVWEDCAKDLDSEGLPLGTFRSYTAYFGGPGLSVRGLCVENAAGGGPGVGQALALYLDGRDARFEDCAILGRQDSLFLGPLPPEPRIPGSFKGPGEARPREPARHLFRNCLIAGDVDFLFGSAEALFLGCELRSLALPAGEPGYLTAASSPEGAEAGFSFIDCRLSAELGTAEVFLGRPWRPFAQVSFLRCEMGGHIHPRGWADWEGGAEDGAEGGAEGGAERENVRFSEGGCYGPGAATGGRVAWARLLDEAATEAEARRVLGRFGLSRSAL